jgi:hypothetical protein
VGVDVILEKTVSQKLDFDCRVRFVSMKIKFTYIASFTSLTDYNIPLLNCKLLWNEINKNSIFSCKSNTPASPF